MNYQLKVKRKDGTKETLDLLDKATLESELSKYLQKIGGTLSGELLFDSGTTTQSKTKGLKWQTINNHTPYFGYALDQVDGTFVWSINGTNYSSGLAIGGGSGNLLWKGNKVTTIQDLQTIQTDISNIYDNYLPLSGGIMKGDIQVPKTGGGLKDKGGYALIADTKNGISLGNNYNTVSITKLKSITAPTTSDGSIYGVGTNGQVLKTNGSTIYWGNTSSGTSFTLKEDFSISNGTSNSPTEIDVSGYSENYEVWISCDTSFYVKTAYMDFGSFQSQSIVVIKVRLVENMFYIIIQGKEESGSAIFDAINFVSYDELIYVYDQDGSGTTEISIIGE